MWLPEKANVIKVTKTVLIFLLAYMFVMLFVSLLLFAKSGKYLLFMTKTSLSINSAAVIF